MKTSHIAILLTTYNGEKYLSQLLDSIVNQSCKNWDLYIRDDQSTDNTYFLIEQYVSLYSNIHFVVDGEKRGAANGFIWLLSHVQSECYMFCDQDDIWLSSKIERTYAKYVEVSKKKANIPIVIHTDLIVVDTNLKIIASSFWEYTRLGKIVDDQSYIKYCNSVTGCTMLFNNYAKQYGIKAFRDVVMHDSWIAIVTDANHGAIVPLHEKLVLYRQHTSNTLGAKKYRMTLRHILSNLRRIQNTNIAWFKMVNSISKMTVMDYICHKIILLFIK